VQELATGTRQRGDAYAKQLDTDVRIINDPQRVATNPHVFYIKNTGGRSLVAQETTVLWDGQVATDVAFDILGSPDDVGWDPGEVLKVTVTGLGSASGDHRVRVVTENGASDSLEVRI